jgi:hypothetical protein
VAIGILQAPTSPQNQWMKVWALPVFTKETGFSEKATAELKQGTQLPSASQLQLPSPGQPRVSIIRLEGTPAADSNRIKSALIDAGYTNATITERPPTAFPDKAEVRFYYPADSQNAQSLSDYINQTLHMDTRVNNRSQDSDVAVHRPGDLHVYIK